MLGFSHNPVSDGYVKRVSTLFIHHEIFCPRFFMFLVTFENINLLLPSPSLLPIGLFPTSLVFAYPKKNNNFMGLFPPKGFYSDNVCEHIPLIIKRVALYAPVGRYDGFSKSVMPMWIVKFQ